MTTELETVAAQVNQASCYLDVFGQGKGTPPTPEQHVKTTYRRLARVLHPDSYTTDPERKLAGEAFSKLAALKAEADEAIGNGNYGKPVQLSSVRTKKAEHRIIKQGPLGDLADTFTGASTVGTRKTPAFFKVARHARDNDLLKTEASALKHLRGTDTDDKFHPYVPELLDSLTYTEKGKPARQMNVITQLEGFYTLEQIHAAFPNGLDPLHLVWMWRRLLVALGYAHQNNVVHGAVLPQHVLIHPEMHGLVLVDWCYSVTSDDGDYPPISAIVEQYRNWYPDEVLSKQAPSPATDIALAARCMVQLGGDDPLRPLHASVLPKPFRAFFNGCLLKKQAARPDDAWALLEEFDELLERLGKPFYPRRFRPFVMP